MSAICAHISTRCDKLIPDLHICLIFSPWNMSIVCWVRIFNQLSRTRSCCWLPDALHIWLIVGNILTHLTIYIPVFNGWALIIATCVMLLIAWCVHFFRLVGVLIWPDAYFANLWHNFMPPLKLAGVLMWKGAYFAYLFEHHWNIFYAFACSLCPYFKPVVGGVLVWRESSQTRCSTGGLLTITIMSITMLEGASSKVKVNS